MNILILLIGSNPLPNYVIAKYLLNAERDDKDKMPIPDKIFFVHSSDTDDFSKNIIEKLKEIPNIKISEMDDRIKVEERSFENIKDNIEEKLKGLNIDKNASNLHLNFTGGTKPMAVYSAYTCLKELSEKFNKVIFSDLDPDNYKLNFLDIKDGQSNKFPLNGKISDLVKIKSEDIFELHGIGYENAYEAEGSENGIYENIVNIKDFFSESIKLGDIFKGLRNEVNSICNDNNREINNSRRDYFECEKKLQKKNIKEHKFFEHRFKDIEKFSSLNSIIHNNTISQNVKSIEFPGTQFIEFITGKWLEDLCLEILKDMNSSQKTEFDEIKRSVKLCCNSRTFEIDIIAIKGYELLLCSCSADTDAARIKNKAFEAIYRAQQIGGDKSKVIVVSLLDAKGVELVNKDLSQFDAKFSTLVLGQDDLKNYLKNESDIYQKIKEFF